MIEWMSISPGNELSNIWKDNKYYFDIENIYIAVLTQTE